MSGHLLNELLASAIPEQAARQLIASGHYRIVTPDEAKQAVGVQSAGWIVQFRDLAGDGQFPLNGPGSAPFVRFKPVPALVQRNGTEPPKYLTAKDAGCRPYFSPLLDGKARDPSSACDIDITEGEKKADCACAHGFPTIGLSGVDCWRDKRSGESALLPELAEINWQGRTVRIAFDSDIAHKAGVRSATRELAFELTRRGANVLITTIPCEIPSGPGNPTPERWKNGLDDFIARHGAEAYRVLRTLSRPCVKTNANGELEWIWTPEPGNKATRTKALLAWAVFKDSCAVDPTRGFLHWVGTHWTALDGKPETCIGRPFLEWCDAMGWTRTGIGVVSEQIVHQLRTAREWDPPRFLAFTNGTLNTDTNAFTDGHCREDHITFCHPFPYDPLATCPRWLAFLDEALDGQQGSISVARAAIRWTLQPKDTSAPFPTEVSIDVKGRRGTGKSTFAEVVMGLLGGIGYGAGRLDTAAIQSPTALHQLIGKRAAIDTDASGHISAVGTFNAIVSNEPVGVKKLYVNETSTRLGVVVWRFFNDDITVSGGGEEGMGRRIIHLLFDKQPARRDRGLKAVLQQELPGIFAWAWALPLQQAQHDLATAAQHHEIREAAIDAALARNPKLRFLCDQFPHGSLDDGIAAKALFQRWTDWCGEEGHKPGTAVTFGRDVAKIAGKPRKVGRVKVTTYFIPPMDSFDIPAFLGLDTTPSHHS
jgi:hypothetical protein